MWISRKNYNSLIDRYEKRIDDLLNRLMSNNFSEYKFVKDTKTSEPQELPEPTSRTDEDEYNLEQKRLNDIAALSEKAAALKTEMHS